jgi:hypothetical protein
MVGVSFTERMIGPFAMGVRHPADGAERGAATSWTMTLKANVSIADIRAFLGDPRPSAAMSGELALPGVRKPIPFDTGSFRLFPRSGPALMVYELPFTHDGVAYRLAGEKCWRGRPAARRMWSDTTTLQVRLHRGETTAGEVVGAGVLRIGIGDFARAIASMRAPRAASPLQSGRALGAYAWLFARELSRTYLLPARG